ncbi:MAG: aminoacetone oxidase family FAD-binding enzyme [Chloroflexi bacterium]|nr:aminoacetone oxidase family FAD-binding enzyme [Chloroflexota bacterium]
MNADVVIVGAGAAGLMAAIWAARTHPQRSILLLDGARTLGAKILVAGGGRCNVTHDMVDENAYAGAARNTLKKVLRRFDVAQTSAFFRELGVELKREDTGKLFPVTDSARTVLDALLAAARAANVQLLYPRRVESITRTAGGFCVSGLWGSVETPRVVLATGGRSLPKSGSDGQGYRLAQALGHTLTPRIFPALVPLTLPKEHFICALSGVTVPAALEVRSATGKKLARFSDSTLCTHFGLSGPSVLDISRYYIDAKLDDARAQLFINWLPHKNSEQVAQELQQLGHTTLLRYLSGQLPERLLRALLAAAGLEAATRGDQLTRAARRALVQTLTALPLPVTGNRGYLYAEVTAGGVPLSEIKVETMESRVCPGLFLCGEICDVDGRIGGYNFQWAWSSGYVAGLSV